ncbi:sigma-70 family RNA polymerase sigma factor [Actinophytocola xanthii]|uniref:RNA polymerase sigma factor SigJ n=1 Tax=Actinophytocola xanthii TaxID=1912961 RepID=A0A1Q8CWJ9_9PSEU|nr:sigma-70 family RNA polymerase sigma factor [Actinophytocola xanthii]OLF18754.1 RNA polymerase sigma factor SigJ [Actinophytocola xanthii]
MTVSDEVLAEQFTEHRRHLVGVAYRLTGRLSDAEDAVQEAWLRLSGLDDERRADIRDLRAWLTTVVGHVCLDRLRSAAARRERYVGPWLPEPIVTPFGTPVSDDPLETVVRSDEVRLAAMVVLDLLTPEQRVAFVLHDAFDMPFAEIARVLGCAEATARQHASRGRRAATDAAPPPRATLEEQRALVERLLTAIVAGDIDSVVRLLHPDAVLIGDSDGKTSTARRPMHGADKIIRFLSALVGRYGQHRLVNGELVLVNGDLGMAVPEVPAEAPYPEIARRIAAFTVHDGRITAIYDIANPDKLRHLDF